MTGPEPLKDSDLDRLLAHAKVPTPRADLVDRIVADATRADRVRAIAPPAPRRASRRPWPRRTVIGLIAINLFAASAIAAAFGGHEGFKRLSTFSAQVIHSIAAVIPHRHGMETPTHHARSRAHVASIPERTMPVVSPIREAVEPEMAQPSFAPGVVRARVDPFQLTRVMMHERRLERIAERQAQRHATRQPRRAEGLRPPHPLVDRRSANRPFEFQRRGADRPHGAVAERPRSLEPPITRGVEAGERPLATEVPRDERPEFEPRRVQQDAGGPPSFRERREARLAQRNWRQRAQANSWRRGGGFRARRWRH